MNDHKHPIQPLSPDSSGTIRFKANAIVQHLLAHGGFDMNKLAIMDFSVEDREQFAQLIGYSLGGFCELSYVTDETYAAVALPKLRVVTAGKLGIGHDCDKIDINGFSFEIAEGVEQITVADTLEAMRVWFNGFVDRQVLEPYAQEIITERGMVNKSYGAPAVAEHAKPVPEGYVPFKIDFPADGSDWKTEAGLATMFVSAPAGSTLVMHTPEALAARDAGVRNAALEDAAALAITDHAATVAKDTALDWPHDHFNQDGSTPLKPEASAATQPWSDAVLDQCAIAHMPFHEDNPRKTLEDLISWHVEVSHDPAVSDRAATQQAWNELKGEYYFRYSRMMNCYRTGSPIHAEARKQEILAYVLAHATLAAPISEDTGKPTAADAGDLSPFATISSVPDCHGPRTMAVIHWDGTREFTQADKGMKLYTRPTAVMAGGLSDASAQFNGFDIAKLPPILISCVAKLWPGSEGMFWEAALEKMPARIEELMARPTDTGGAAMVVDTMNLYALMTAWGVRAASAHPSDAMLINKHIRELKEACFDDERPPAMGAVGLDEIGVRAALKPHMEKLVGNYDPCGQAEEHAVKQSMEAVRRTASGAVGLSEDAARYRAWRDAGTGDEGQAFVEACAGALPKDVQIGVRNPTADELDAAIDVARRTANGAAGQEGQAS